MAESTSDSNDKRVQIDGDDKYLQTQKVDARRQLQNSPMLATKYAHESSKLVYSIEKNFYLIICIVSLLFVFSLLDFYCYFIIHNP